ncbi:MAG: ferritin-like domain-containing protein [Gemmatimonadaceae bacterium]|nr:ferritin-like domain-containing protein [Gemmatimonadaceae bacterium]
MALATMHDLMINELQDLYSAETQLVKALPKMAKGATTPSLRKAFEDHLEQTQGHVARLEQVFEMLGATARGKKCKGMEGLLVEGTEMLVEEGDELVKDAGIIAAAQRVEHYEMAAYGSTIAFANVMGHTEIAELLEQTLEEEKAADALLSSIAEDDVNSAAPGMEEDADAGEDEEETVAARAPSRPAAKKGATKSKR